jgi:glycosyltransferase involved in cell wall biosynthesis
MKKLLIITDAWFPQVNGVVTVFDRVSSLLRERGMEVTIVHPELFKHRFPLPLYPEVPMVLFPRKTMREIFKREKPDAVHIATEWTLGLSARSICLRNNIPYTSSYHTNFPLYAAHYFKYGYLLSPIASLYMKWFHHASQALMVSTKTLQRKLLDEGFKNVVVWPFGIDTEFFKKNESKIPEEAKELEHPIFVYFGRVCKEKGVSEFINASLPGTKLIIGDGPLRKELEANHGDRVKFVGYKKGQELVNWLSACDVCVFPSRTETFGLVVLEALSCGLPVAAHNALGPSDIITNGVDGYLDDDLARAALNCTSLSADECRKKASQYPWDASADIFTQHIRTVPLIQLPTRLRGIAAVPRKFAAHEQGSYSNLSSS